MVAAIYKITNTVNNKVYIGKTVDVDRRWYQHREALRSGNHIGRSSEEMCHDANVYGHGSFTFEILEEFSLSDMHFMDEREIHFVLEHGSIDPTKGYNKPSFPRNWRRVVERETAKAAALSERLRVGLGRNRFIQKDLSGQIVAEWDSWKLLVDGVGFPVTRQGVSAACTGKNKTYKGYRWETVRCR